MSRIEDYVNTIGIPNGYLNWIFLKFLDEHMGVILCVRLLGFQLGLRHVLQILSLELDDRIASLTSRGYLSNIAVTSIFTKHPASLPFIMWSFEIWLKIGWQILHTQFVAF